MSIPSLEELLSAACHFGHPRRKWNPKMAPYIFGTEKGVHIFDLERTHEHLRLVCDTLKTLQSEGKTILFASTKQQSTAMIEDIGRKLHQPVVTKKWIGGLLTNWKTLKKRIQYYLDLKKSFQTREVEKYTKKEQTQLRKEMLKLEEAFSGIADMKDPPHALFVIDALRDIVAVREANVLKIPVFGICDSNADPDLFTAFIPANDDAVKSIEIILTTVAEELEGVERKGNKGIEGNKGNKVKEQAELKNANGEPVPVP